MVVKDDSIRGDTARAGAVVAVTREGVGVPVEIEAHHDQRTTVGPLRLQALEVDGKNMATQESVSKIVEQVKRCDSKTSIEHRVTASLSELRL